MSANIATINGRESCFALRTPPWHKLGVTVEQAPTAAEAMHLAGLDWTVGLQPLALALAENNQAVPASVGRAIVRESDNTVLGIGGARYTPIQNTELFSVLDPIVAAGKGEYDSAGALGQGERVWASVRLGDGFEVTPGDKLSHYLLATTSHDGSGAFTGRAVSTRVVCQNTLTAALGEHAGGRWELGIRHTASAEQRIREAGRLLEQSTQALIRQGQVLQAMASTPFSYIAGRAFLHDLFGLPDDKEARKDHPRTANRIDRVLSGFAGEALGAEMAGETAWGMLNAVTEEVDHWTGGTRTQAARATSSTFGAGEVLKRATYEKLAQLVHMTPSDAGRALISELVPAEQRGANETPDL